MGNTGKSKRVWCETDKTNTGEVVLKLMCDSDETVFTDMLVLSQVRFRLQDVGGGMLQR